MGNEKTKADTKSKDKLLEVLIDTREPDRYASLLKQNGIPIKVETLETGDFVIGNVIIERKTVPDLFNSIRDRRIWNQLFRMHKLTEDGFRAVLLVEGEVPTWDYYTNSSISQSKYNWYLNIIKSIEAKCYVSYGVFFKWIRSDTAFVDFIKSLFTSMRTYGKSKKPILEKKEFRCITEIKSDMLCAIPLIGRSTADHLSSQYTIEKLCEFSIEQLSGITLNKRKLGELRARNIFEALHK